VWLKEQMEVVPHQTIRGATDIESRCRHFQQIQVALVVNSVSEDGLLPISSRHDVIKLAGSM
jgi:hypothetical protein